MKGAENEGTRYAGMQVCRYAGILLLMVLLSACAESGGGGNYSDFVYNGPENGICLDSSYNGPADDYSRESEGICIIGGKEYRYRYDAANKYLAENREARKLTGLDGNVSNCYDAGLVVAAANYLNSRVKYDEPDVGQIPAGKEYPPEEEIIETEEQLGDSDGDIEPLIWKGSSVNSTLSESIVEIRYTAPGGGTIYICSGVVINEKWILTAGHCTLPMIASGSASTCTSCFTAYWTNPNTGVKECITDNTSGHTTCQTWKTVWARVHENYIGQNNVLNDIGLIYYSTGWNETISEARLYNGTPSISWPSFYGWGYGSNSMCVRNFVGKRRGVFSMDNVYSLYSYSEANDDFRFCGGDSGGPWQKWTGEYYLTFGVMSEVQKGICSGSSECSEGGVQKTCCAAPTGAGQVSCRIDAKIQWIKDYTNLNCPSSTSYGFPFVRCNQ